MAAQGQAHRGIRATERLSGSGVDVEGDVIAASTNRESLSVFRYDGAGWNETRISRPVAGEDFGASLDLDANRLVVGAPNSDQTSTAAGRAYVYDWDGANWVLTGSVTPDPADKFGGLGKAAALDGDRLALRDSLEGGRVKIFELVGPTWVLEATLEPQFRKSFGAALDLEGVFLIAGDPRRGQDWGRALLYQLENNGWSLVADLEDSIVLSDANFGRSVALHEGHALIGAPRFSEDGVVASFSVLAPLALEADPLWTIPGDSVEFTICRGAQNSLIILVATEVQGIPTFLKVASGLTGSDGRWSFAASVPPVVTGLVAQFKGLGFSKHGELMLTAPVQVQFD